jgi:hypothetical protein
MGRDEISLRRFRWMLEQRRYGYLPEGKLARAVTLQNTIPDFYVDTGHKVRFLVEVESFEKETILRRSSASVISLNPMALQKRINRAVRNAADQLEPYALEAIPLVITLDNHRQVGLNIGHIELIELFGQIGYGITIDTTTGRTVSEGWEQNDDCPLVPGRRDFVSAVIVNIPEWRDDPDDFSVERPMRVHVIHNPNATHPLPLWVFSLTDDRQIVNVRNRWIEIQSPPAEILRNHIARRAFEIYESRGRRDGGDVFDWLEAERELRERL